MNGIERITRRIQEDNQLEIDRILNEANAEAEKISAKYRAQADAESAAFTARNERAAAEREERLVSVAQMESRKVRLAAKQEMVEKVYDLALEKLCAMPDEQYTQVVAALLVKAAPDGKGEVIFAPEENERLGKAAVDLANEKLNGRLVLSEQTRPLRGGFVLKNGDVEVNCTFETLVRLQKAETTGLVAKKLFPGV